MKVENQGNIIFEFLRLYAILTEDKSENIRKGGEQ